MSGWLLDRTLAFLFAYVMIRRLRHGVRRREGEALTLRAADGRDGSPTE
jgi:hypothetical protein